MSAATSTYICSALLVFTAGVHSWLGEVRLIGPLLSQRDGILGSEMARLLIRFVWHVMTVCFLILAAGLVVSVGDEGPIGSVLLWGTAIGIGGAGIIDGIGTRGRHIGWPLLVLIGAFALWAIWAR